MRNIGISFLLIGILLSCSDNENPTSNSVQTKAPVQKTPEIENLIDTSIVSAFQLVDVQDLNPAIVVELKYATTDNFMGMVLYERLKSAYLQKDVAERLSKVQDYLSKVKPGYRLCIYDALRPVSVQQKMWDALDSLPPVERGKFVSNPKNRSLHNLGAAVDLTILDHEGNALDMGANYDDIRQIAYPSMEQQFLAEGKLTQVQLDHRDLLRKIMTSQGFRQIPTEWWHFNACSRQEGLKKYRVLLTEP